jgi:hypothetical protein
MARIGGCGPGKEPSLTARRLVTAWAGLIWLFAAIPAWATSAPSLLILPLDWVDTSGETPAHAKEHTDRLAELGRYLSRSLADAGLYAISDPTPIAAEVEHARATQPLDSCNGCERDLAKLVHADRVLVGEIDKVSTLIGAMRLSIVDVATGRTIFARVLSFRGDTDTAWDNAIRFFVRDLSGTRPEQR